MYYYTCTHVILADCTCTIIQGRVAVCDIKVIPADERAPHGYRLLQWTLDDSMLYILTRN